MAITISNIRDAILAKDVTPEPYDLAENKEAVMTKLGQLYDALVTGASDDKKRLYSPMMLKPDIYKLIVNYVNENKPTGVTKVDGGSLRPYWRETVSLKLAELPPVTE